VTLPAQFSTLPATTALGHETCVDVGSEPTSASAAIGVATEHVTTSTAASAANAQPLVRMTRPPALGFDAVAVGSC
jgi:hypothetical protein